jgi:hypothetical protein
MGEWDNDGTFWKRTSMVLGGLLALSIVTIIVLLACIAMRSSAHHLELNAIRAQSERERDILTKMWEATEATLSRERKATAGAKSLKK